MCGTAHTPDSHRYVYVQFRDRSLQLNSKWTQALKKQKANIPEQGDLFGDAFEEESSEELFASPKGAAEEVVGTPNVPVDAVKPSRGMDSQERLQRFNEKLQFVGLRIGRDRKEKLPQIRNAAWQELFQLATTREQMEAVVNLFPKWRDTKPGRVFNVQNAELFTRECSEFSIRVQSVTVPRPL